MKSVRALPALQSRRPVSSRSVCPSCAFAASAVTQSIARPRAPPNRHAATLTSRTAVNATKTIPPRLQKLYKELEALNKEATNFVSLPRLQLALRSLEDENPVTRIAVLGLHGVQGARQLARLLSADVLDPEGDWEQQLAQASLEDEHNYILRYGNQPSVSPANSTFTTLYIPSPILQKHRLELLVSSLNLTSQSLVVSDAQELRSSALVPVATTPSSIKHAAVSFVRYPVHRAIVLGEGLDGALALGRFPLHAQDNDVLLALNLPGLDTAENSVLPVLDLSRAAEGIDLFRQSTSNGSKYQVAWHASNLPRVAQWLEASVKPSESGLPTATYSLLTSLLSSTAAAIPSSTPARAPISAQPLYTEPVPLLSNLQDWSLRAHTELQASLDAARASKQWSHLSWWKIPWRADDVSLFLTETLDRSWLVDAEKGVLFLAGRAAERGIHPSEAELYPWQTPKAADDATSAVPLFSPKQFPATPANASNTAVVEASPQPVDTIPAAPGPWPALIPTARSTIAQATIPTLHARAQSLTLATLSLSGSSLALSALTYASLSVSVFEAGAIAAVGSVFAFWRMQRNWEGAREQWLAGLREQGRRVLGMVQQRVQTDLHRGKAEVDEEVVVSEAEAERQQARQAVERARAALEELEADR